MSLPSATHLLHRLSRLHGIQTVYYDVAGRRHQASPEALLAILQALGTPVSTLKDVPSAFEESLLFVWGRPLPPVAVAWDGAPTELSLRLPESRADAPLTGHLLLETGESRTISWKGSDLPATERAEVDGARYTVKSLPLSSLPWGYHRLAIEGAGEASETLIMAAPQRAYTQKDRIWGVFSPLYALHSRRSWGCGDLSDLESLMDWIAPLGGRVVATLPFLASLLEGNTDPSPYAPISRLFWSEVYIDVTRAPELASCPEAQSLLSSVPFQQEIESLQSSEMVDYPRVMALKRRSLEALSACFFARQGERLHSFHRYLEATPWLEKYALFRAARERRQARSSLSSIDDAVAAGDYDESARRYHLYTQWLLHEQLQAISRRAKSGGGGLYLDFPLGVSAQGFDAWHWPELFVQGASGGAPPDIVFTAGQNWGFPPIHPQRARQQGHEYFRACICRHLLYAHMLRIDHVIGLHRLFWIPRGMEPSQGVYVEYPAEELYAVLALESQRARALVIGEDLGTVPPYVRPAMASHDIYRSYVVQYELAADSAALSEMPPLSAASLNTHDMFPFAAFWQGLDIEERMAFGLLDKAGAEKERAEREAIRIALSRLLEQAGWLRASPEGVQDILRACLSYLSASPAAIFIANLEDLWLETHPQNIPSTEKRRPNWRRRLRYSYEELSRLSEVRGILSELGDIRKGRQSNRGT